MYLQALERRKERDEISKNKMKASFCSTDVLSKMFGTTYQEGEGYSEGDRHILVNAFPQEDIQTFKPRNLQLFNILPNIYCMRAVLCR